MATLKKCGCKTCEDPWKPVSEFSKDKHQPDGLNNKCRECCKGAWQNYSTKTYGSKPMSENKECSQYLGIVATEKVLSLVFKDVQRMPTHAHGYDFICNRGYKVDVKSSGIITRKGKTWKQWQFDINKNQDCDAFACVSFDRAKLKPLKMWLIPNKVISHLKTFSIGQKNFSKWEIYEKPIDKVLACCEALKNTKGEIDG